MGITTVGRVTLSITTELDLIDAKLYHICLGHLSERSIVELHKRNLLKSLKIGLPWIVYTRSSATSVLS